MTITVADLRTIDLLDDLDDAALEEWVAVAQERHYAPGDLLCAQGAEPPGLELLLEGAGLTSMQEGERREPVGRQVAPTWIFAISALTGSPVPVQLQAETPCRVALIEPADFERLAFAHPEVHRRVMRQVAPVMANLMGIEQNRERLAALGTMAAGLAHELNNPAAAARRAAADLADAVEVVVATLHGFVEAGIERDTAAQMLALHGELCERALARAPLDALDAAAAEDEVLEHLEALGVPEPWRLAEPLAAAGTDAAWIDRMAELAGPATPMALRWTAATLTARGLTGELLESTERMSGLVGAVKAYAYMDRGAVVDVDVHEGLETTLKVLGHKLKHTQIEVVRDYDRELPRLSVRGPELNQVWTNLFDNAIDALGERGTITIATRRDGDCARIDVSDDGPGIPPEVRDRIFDSFFTTKDVGHGTGLGLATARRIVVDRHGGSLTVDSEPDRTTFHVWLPYS